MKVTCSRCNEIRLVRKDVYQNRLNKTTLTAEEYDKVYVCQKCRTKFNVDHIGGKKQEIVNQTLQKLQEQQNVVEPVVNEEVKEEVTV